MIKRPLIGILLATIALAACDDTVAPPPFAGTFVLASVFTSSAPPVILYQQSTRSTILSRSEVYADTLVISADGTWQERTTYRFTENPETAPVVSFSAGTGKGTWAFDPNGGVTFTPDPGVGGMLYNLAMKPATQVEASADSLVFENVIQFSLDWKPKFRRAP